MKSDLVRSGRLRTHSFHSQSLEGNSLGVPADRNIMVYLPPGYFQTGAAYPVIYVLHGYGGDANHVIVDRRERLEREFPAVVRFLFRRMFRRVVTLETLDELILNDRLPPFILVQPDGSLHLPHKRGGVHPGGDPKVKGSMYVDSPSTGRFGLSVFRDAVDYIDSRFRTLPTRESRAVMGGSMGGYGALLAGIFHPDRFCAVAALSPSICGLDVIDLDLFVPVLRWIRGKAAARQAGRDDVFDILDTCDLIFSADRPLIPTVQRDASGEAVGMDETARANWAAWDAGKLAQTVPHAFDGVAVRVTCEERDEFGFAEPDRRFSADLNRAGVHHEFRIFRDFIAARLSAHSAGIALEVEPGLRFCLDHMVLSPP